jgi:hypothetical protein
MVSISVQNTLKRVNVTAGQSQYKTTNVLVARQRTVQISANATLGIIDSSSPVTLINTPTLVSAGAVKLEQLKDVDTTNKVNGAALVYESSNNSYVVRQLDITELAGGLHGGTF